MKTPHMVSCTTHSRLFHSISVSQILRSCHFSTSCLSNHHNSMTVFLPISLNAFFMSTSLYSTIYSYYLFHLHTYKILSPTKLLFLHNHVSLLSLASFTCSPHPLNTGLQLIVSASYSITCGPCSVKHSWQDHTLQKC